MIFDTVRIISWFGNRDNEKLREKRKNIHSNQVEFFLRHKMNVVVYAQDYDIDDYIPEVRYIVNTDDVILKPGAARNVLLNDFYISNEDYCFICDNDSIFYDFKEYHSDGINIVDIIKNDHINNWSGVAIIRPIYPRLEPYSDFYYKNKTKIDENILLYKTIMLKGSAFILQNLKKHHNIEIFYDDSPFYKDGVWYGGEDICFGADILMINLGVFKSNNFILKEMALDNYRTWISEESSQKIMTELVDKHLTKKYNLTRKEITSHCLVKNMIIPKNRNDLLELIK